MTSKYITAYIEGYTGATIEVEGGTLRGLPAMNITGLPDSTIREARDRIRSAIENAGFLFPPKNYIINLAPAHKKKMGSSFDLAMACAILRETDQIHLGEDTALVGELALDGTIRPVTGVISMSLALAEKGIRKVAVPRENAEEAAAPGSIEVYPLSHLRDILTLQNAKSRPFKPGAVTRGLQVHMPDFSDIKGQESAVRAMEIAVAGMHNILLYGSPGSGKTMLARRVPGIMPPLTRIESLESTMIHSTAGFLGNNTGLMSIPPFRAPHHTSSYAAMTGGGPWARAGEVSLAHNGVLFLDELTEFSSHTLQTLRQPLEDHVITVSRSAATVTYPCRFMLVAAANPCRCGNLMEEDIPCTCSTQTLQKYIQKLNSPVIDRIDMEVAMNRIPWDKLKDTPVKYSSATIRASVIEARKIQEKRFRLPGKYNGSMTTREITKFCLLSDSTSKLMEKAYRSLDLTARSYHRILKVSRTIADVDHSINIEEKHLLEALSYRGLQQKLGEMVR